MLKCITKAGPQPVSLTKFMKRIFDFSFALIFLILIAPFLLLIAFLIGLSYGRPILFTQLRAGFKGRPFYLRKYRTMTNDVDDNGCLLPDKTRLTRLGRFLRKWSLDELPELFNVLGGSMSFVGPRPLLMEYLQLYTNEQARRHDVKPGITGWAQVNGRNAVSWEKRFEMDVWYVDNKNILLDLKIIFMTFKKVLKCEGIAAEEHVTMPKFRGSQIGAT